MVGLRFPILTMNINEQIEKIPGWKRFLICHLNRRKWKVARAYNTVCVDLMHGLNWELGDTIREHGNVKWAELYGVVAPKLDNGQWQARAVIAESELEWMQERCKQLEEQVALLKKTSRGMHALRRQRSLPNIADMTSRPKSD